MTSKTIVEWRCERCGAEEAIEQGKDHAWCQIGRLHLRVNDGNRYVQKKLSSKAEAIHGDLCPVCASDLVTWWHAPRQPTRQTVEVDDG